MKTPAPKFRRHRSLNPSAAGVCVSALFLCAGWSLSPALAQESEAPDQPSESNAPTRAQPSTPPAGTAQPARPRPPATRMPFAQPADDREVQVVELDNGDREVRMGESLRMVVHARSTPGAAPADDSRPRLGGFVISRARAFWNSASGYVIPPADAAYTEGVVRADGSIVVPDNTPGSPGVPAGETLQQRSERLAAEGREAHARAKEAEAQAEIARIDALNAQDDRRRGGLILLHGGYGHGGYRYPIFRASPLSRGNSAAADPNSGPLAPTVTVERFKGDFARSAFGHAARPNIAPIVRANAEYQRRFADAASRDEIIAPQRAVDAQVRGHKLEREPVDNH